MKKQNVQVHNYLVSEVNSFIEPLVYQLVLSRPGNPVQFAIQWLSEYNKKKRYRSKTVINSDTEDEYQDEVKELNEKIEKRKNNRKHNKSRMGISEEVFGEFNNRESIQIRQSHHLEQNQKILVLSLMRNSIVFQNLDSKDEEIVLRAMVSRETYQHELIIKQGEPGDDFFIVASGQYDCYKLKEDQNVFIKTYVQGQTFGELALMYNAPRAASIVCKMPGKLLALDRSIFSQIIKIAAIRKQKLIESALQKLQIFKIIPPEHRYTLINILKQQRFGESQYIIKEGDAGDKFYIVLQGTLSAQKYNQSQLPKVVMTYHQGDYFGQLALINNQPRKASVKTITKAKVACITREGFKRVFEPYLEQLKSQFSKYNQQ